MNTVGNVQIHNNQSPHAGKSIAFTSDHAGPIDAVTGRPLELHGDTVELSPESLQAADQIQSVAVTRTERKALLDSFKDSGFSITG